MPRHFLIDTDTASDDAVALVMALMYPDVQVEAITVVAGNVPLDQAVQNALYTVSLTGKQVPVYRGAAGPMLRTLGTAQDVHGMDGMGDLGLPLSGRSPTPGSAVQVIIDTINRFAGDITLVTLGPLTNVALALMIDPSLAQKVTRCVVMGGTWQAYGNITPVAEYNIWVDPEAAKIVFESGLPLEMVSWDISRLYAVLTPADAATMRQLGTPLAQFCIDIQGRLNSYALESTQLKGFDLPDPIAMAVALDPSIATDVRQLYVAVDTQSDLCRGQTVVDHLNLTKRPANVAVVMVADHDKFVQMLTAAVLAPTH